MDIEPNPNGKLPRMSYQLKTGFRVPGVLGPGEEEADCLIVHDTFGTLRPLSLAIRTRQFGPQGEEELSPLMVLVLAIQLLEQVAEGVNRDDVSLAASDALRPLRALFGSPDDPLFALSE